MGMFDILNDQYGIEWQTKSFTRPSLSRYRVTAEGHLEKGEPLDIPQSCFDDDFRELIAKIERIAEEGPRFTWKRYDFTGVVQALTLGLDGESRVSNFEFRGGILV